MEADAIALERTVIRLCESTKELRAGNERRVDERDSSTLTELDAEKGERRLRKLRR
jgi:hypothetical protein